MTYQPPPPPPPPPAGPPSSGQSPFGGAGGSFDPKSVNRLDWGILAAGFLAFIFSFFSYYTYSASISFGGFHESASVSVSAWHGFFGWFAMLAALVGSAAVAAELFMPQLTLPVPARLVALGAYALATLCVLLALFVYPGAGYDGPGVDTGHGVGYWLSLIVIVGGAVMSYLRFTQTGGTLPIGKR